MADWNEVDLFCPHCSSSFAVPKTMKGGMANCPDCQKAVEVAGGPEPLFWFLFGLGGLGILLVSGLLFAAAGPIVGLIGLMVGATILTVLVLAS